MASECQMLKSIGVASEGAVVVRVIICKAALEGKDVNMKNGVFMRPIVIH